MHPPFSTAIQTQPLPPLPPPVIPDEHHPHSEGDLESDVVPVDLDDQRRARRRRAFYARALGVLGILLVAGFAFVTVGRAWLSSLPSVIWPSSLERPESPLLPVPLGPPGEPMDPSAPVEPPMTPPLEAAPIEPPVAAPAELPATAAPVEPLGEATSATTAKPLPAVRPPNGKQPRPVRHEPSEGVPSPADPRPPVETVPDEGLTPEELPARPPVDPASPLAPPAGEAPLIPDGEADMLFGDE